MYFHSPLSESKCYLAKTDSLKWPPGTCDAHSLPISITLLPLLFSPLSPVRLLECSVFFSFFFIVYHFRFIIVLSFLQATEMDFSNVGSMIECGLFIEALDSIRSALFPGLLPPVAYLVSLLEYAQQVGPELPDCKSTHLLLRWPQCLHKTVTCFITFIFFFLLNGGLSIFNAHPNFCPKPFTSRYFFLFFFLFSVLSLSHREMPHPSSWEICNMSCTTCSLPTLPGWLPAHWKNILPKCCSVLGVRRACGLF